MLKYRHDEKDVKYQTKYLQLFSLANLGDNSGVFTRILSLRLAGAR